MEFLATLFHTLFTYPILNALMLLYYWLGDFSLALVALTLSLSTTIAADQSDKKTSARNSEDSQTLCF